MFGEMMAIRTKQKPQGQTDRFRLSLFIVPSATSQDIYVPRPAVARRVG